ncbi:MAG: hypothetical protein GX267_06925 [Fibrobacter sp.]|jgi:hypothetical protein|nr:hypothetical protein [Fibrobacter sp.]
MGRFKFKKALFGLTTVATALSLYAANQLLDNHQDATNENELERYWFYYDDFAGTKADDRPTSAPESKPSVIKVEYKDKEITLKNGNKHTMKDYVFTVDSSSDGNKFATMPFEFGENWTAIEGEYEAKPFVGIGTGLSAKQIDLTKPTEATGVRFKMRSRGEPLTVTFQVETRSIIDAETFAYHGKDLIATDEWEEFEVLFSELTQPGWHKAKDPLDLTEVVQFAWQVHGEKNDEITEGVLDLDDIEILDWTYLSPTLETKWADMGDTTGKYAFATFEKNPKNEVKFPNFKSYWYAYDDAEINGKSEVIEGAERDDKTKRLDLLFEDKTGPDDKGTAPYLYFKLGKPVIREEDGVKIRGFVGIGINVYDSLDCEYWNASNYDYIYFHYKTAGVKKATLEISDSNDVPDAKHPNRKDKRGSGVVWYRDLQDTKEEWKAVKIYFDSLKAHEDWDVYKHIPLDKSALAKIQIKVQGDEGTEGLLSIDNIYLGKAVPVLTKVNKVNDVRFAASYRNGRININWAGKTGIAEGKISLFDAKGCMVQSSNIAKVSRISENISANTLASGIYIVKLSGVDVNGKEVSMQTSLNVLK